MVVGPFKGRQLSCRALGKEKLHAERLEGWAVLWRKRLLHHYPLLPGNWFAERLSASPCPQTSAVHKNPQTLRWVECRPEKCAVQCLFCPFEQLLWNTIKLHAVLYPVTADFTPLVFHHVFWWEAQWMASVAMCVCLKADCIHFLLHSSEARL